jgi:hypothetical protein
VNGDGRVDQWDHDAARRARLAEAERATKRGDAEKKNDAEYVEEPGKDKGTAPATEPAKDDKAKGKDDKGKDAPKGKDATRPDAKSKTDAALKEDKAKTDAAKDKPKAVTVDGGKPVTPASPESPTPKKPSTPAPASPSPTPAKPKGATTPGSGSPGGAKSG